MALNQQQFQRCSVSTKWKQTNNSSQIGSALGGIAGAFAGGLGNHWNGKIFFGKEYLPPLPEQRSVELAVLLRKYLATIGKGNPIYGSGNGQRVRRAASPINYTAFVQY